MRGCFSNVRTSYLGSVFVLVVLQLTTFAQGGVGSSRGLPSTSGGIHTIQGKVIYCRLILDTEYVVGVVQSYERTFGWWICATTQ